MQSFSSSSAAQRSSQSERQPGGAWPSSGSPPPQKERTKHWGSCGLPGRPCRLVPAGSSVHLGCPVLSVRNPCFHSLRLLSPAFYLLCPATGQMKRSPEVLVGKFKDQGGCMRPIDLCPSPSARTQPWSPASKPSAGKCHPPVCHRRRWELEPLAYHSCSIFMYKTGVQTTPNGPQQGR